MSNGREVRHRALFIPVAVEKDKAKIAIFAVEAADGDLAVCRRCYPGIKLDVGDALRCVSHGQGVGDRSRDGQIDGQADDFLPVSLP